MLDFFNLGRLDVTSAGLILRGSARPSVNSPNTEPTRATQNEEEHAGLLRSRQTSRNVGLAELGAA